MASSRSGGQRRLGRPLRHRAGDRRHRPDADQPGRPGHVPGDLRGIGAQVDRHERRSGTRGAGGCSLRGSDAAARSRPRRRRIVAADAEDRFAVREGAIDSIGHRVYPGSMNLKFEIRISKFETSSKDRNSKFRNRAETAPRFGPLIIRICFGFRASDFGFSLRTPRRRHRTGRRGCTPGTRCTRPRRTRPGGWPGRRCAGRRSGSA